jgi:hypothetical protein
MIKLYLKKIKYLNRINQLLKSSIYGYELKRLKFKYKIYSKIKNLNYSEDEAIKMFKNNIHNKLKNQEWFCKGGKPNIFWIGTNYDQDYSGLLQDLDKISNLRIFWRNERQYGFSFDSRNVDIQRKENDKCLSNIILQAHRNHKIDIILGQMWADIISPSVLKHFKNLGIIIINISMDDKLPSMWYGKNHGTLGLKDGLDLVLTTVKECCSWYWAENIPSLYWPLGSSNEIFYESDNRDIDISFIGNNYGYRGRIINSLINSGLPVTAYGYGWANGYIDSKKAAEVLSRSKISLGIATVGHTKNIYTMKLRDFDAPMSGALYITQYNKELEHLYISGEEIIFYDSIEELIQKIKYYLANDAVRTRIAAAGKKKAMMNYKWENRFTSIIDLISSSSI